MSSYTLIILFESRMLLRNGISCLLREKGYTVVTPLSIEQLTEALCRPIDGPVILLVGAAGLKDMLFRMMRILHSTRLMELQSVVYQPWQDGLLSRFFISAGANYCLTEQELTGHFFLRGHDAEAQRPRRPLRPRHQFSLSELDIMLSYAKGMQTRDIATQCHCSYKTVFSIKRNAMYRMDMTAKADWLALMTDISQLQEKEQ